MKCYGKFFIFALLALLLNACSGGPAKAPLPTSITSPANLLNQGITQHHNNHYSAAIRSFKKALIQYRSIDNQLGIAKSCMNIAKSFMANNHNKAAAQYLTKAKALSKQSSLTGLDDHLKLLESSLAIKNSAYEQASQHLLSPLSSSNTSIKLAAFKNQTTIAFAENNADKKNWLHQYKILQNKNPKNTNSHLARILRFEAELSNINSEKINLLTKSLTLSRGLANRTAIAANLTQWANMDAQQKRFEQAEDKLLRALFIRHQLNDEKNSLVLLKQLNLIYIETHNEKQKQTENWVNDLSQDKLIDWSRLFSEFDSYPQSP